GGGDRRPAGDRDGALRGGQSLRRTSAGAALGRAAPSRLRRGECVAGAATVAHAGGMNMSVQLRELGAGDDEETSTLWTAVFGAGGTSTRGSPLPDDARRVVALRDGVPVGRAAFGSRS